MSEIAELREEVRRIGEKLDRVLELLRVPASVVLEESDAKRLTEAIERMHADARRPK